ncbi:MAG: hypothetical protein K0S63_1261 [Gammaproteobacteria bacterium]|jgi:putative ABC transport system ATP-binding protein|nr:hypothetical protein [Gammaproteobacteria bacterium]
MTIEENILLLEMQHTNLSTKNLLNELKDYLADFNKKLAVSFETPVSRLSGGEQQILVFALYLRRHPSLLLLDEHTSALDPRISEKTMEFTNEIIAQRKITCIMTTHNMDYALNRLIAIHEGQLLFTANPTEKRQLTKSSLLEHFI